MARIPVQSPNTPSPQIITKAATSRPSGVIGTTSPYPIVVRVTTAHHKAAGTLPKVAGWTSRSRKYSATEARNSTIRKITSTLNSGPDSSTSTRRNCRSPGTPGTTLSIQSTPSSHADLGIGAQHEGERHGRGGDGIHQPAPGQRVSPVRVAP